MAVPPPPPRYTGDPEVDGPAASHYLHDFYEAAVIEGYFLNTEEQLADGGDFDPASLPDPASTTVAIAQDTANNAYILANFAEAHADNIDVTIASMLPPAGQITIADLATTGAFTLTPAQVDTSYYVSITPVTVTGAATAGSSRVRSVAKATGTVTITVETAPGAGTSVTFDIVVRRNS